MAKAETTETVGAEDISDLSEVRPAAPEELESIVDYESLLRHVKDTGQFVDSEELGDGFGEIIDKKTLVGTEFTIVDWYYGKNLQFGDNAFVVVKIIKPDNTRGIFTDGSSGIKKQLERTYLTRRVKIVRCRRGLNPSEYWVKEGTNEVVQADYTGKKSKAVTYYIHEGS